MAVTYRARHRMEGQQLHGNNIHLDFVPRNPTYNNNKPGTTQDANNNDTKAGGVKSKQWKYFESDVGYSRAPGKHQIW